MIPIILYLFRILCSSICLDDKDGNYMTILCLFIYFYFFAATIIKQKPIKYTVWTTGQDWLWNLNEIGQMLLNKITKNKKYLTTSSTPRLKPNPRSLMNAIHLVCNSEHSTNLTENIAIVSFIQYGKPVNSIHIIWCWPLCSFWLPHTL